MDEKQTTSGATFLLGGRLVSWLSKKKNFISQSIAKEEYVIVENNYNQVLWIKHMLKDIKIEFA